MSSPELPDALSAEAVAIYRRALMDGEFVWDNAAAATGLDKDVLEQARDELVAHFLLQPISPSDQRLRPINPELAAAKLAEPYEEAIRAYRTAAEGTREQLLQLMPAYLGRTISGPVSGGLEIISDPAEVQLLINNAATKCTRDLMTVQPGGKRSTAQLQSLPFDLNIARRGVRFRMIYQHTTRTQLHMRSYVSAMVEAGAEIRTADQLPDILFIVDREIAFIPKRTHADQMPGALVVREPVLISFLCTLFEQFWITSSPFLDEGPGYQNASDDLRRSLLELLAQGLKDEVVARRLGMSVRTCRRHIATLLQELGAESRFEAGVRAAQLGLLKRRDSDE
ncbi:LuxR C-terminal-related transcriptional regulator [Streptacidiphilus sp. MAP5-3]|uniref:helix-turn-helix transcriptional regulator n=1 Tax=unclassified Streptacidiphilus TaxID=2643834 RepID=UPI00351844B0